MAGTNFLTRLRQPWTAHWKWCLPLVGVVIAIDQWSKWSIYSNPDFQAQECLTKIKPCGSVPVAEVFDLTMVWNQGISFGALQADGPARWLLLLLTLVVTGVFLGWLTRARHPRTAFALALIIAGALGNAIDRFRFGAVVDFLDFRDLMFPWVFNVADAAISAGAVVLLLDQLLAGPKKTG